MFLEELDSIISICGRQFKLIQWRKGDPIDSGGSSFVGIDTETEYIKKDRPIVPITLQICFLNSATVYVAQEENIDPLFDLLEKQYPSIEWVFVNAAFDLRVLGAHSYRPHLLDYVEKKGKITDLMFRFALREMENGTFMGRYGMAEIASKVLHYNVDKSEDIRCTFKKGATLTLEHIEYAAKDSIVTCLARQLMPRSYDSEHIELKGAIALDCIEWNGFRVDPVEFSNVKEKFKQVCQKTLKICNSYGWYPNEPGNSSVLQEIAEEIEKREGCTFDRTEKTNLIQFGSSLYSKFKNSRPHPFLAAYRMYKNAEKILASYLNDALILADGKVHPHFTTILKTLRTSCQGPNLQNLPKAGGVREIYIPEEGKVLCSCDYNQLELATLADSCIFRFGKSVMADLINAGEDLHTFFGKGLANKSGKPYTKKLRSNAKISNFGRLFDIFSYYVDIYFSTFLIENSMAELKSRKKSGTLKWESEVKALWKHSSSRNDYQMNPILRWNIILA